MRRCILRRGLGHAAGLAFLLPALSAFAQAQTQTPQPTGSISGTVRDVSTNLPIPDLQISGGRKNTVTDTNGHYTLRELSPGQVRLGTPPDFRKGIPPTGRSVSLAPGQDLTSVDLMVRPYAEISGKVVDQNGEPVPDALVSLVYRQYWLGSLRYNFTSAGLTDDQGNYTIQRVDPGRPFLLLLRKQETKLDPISTSPANPKLRRPAWVPTYYPGSASVDGAQAVTLGPGEHRQRVDFEAIRSSSYCASGTVQAPAGAGRVSFNVSESQPAFGTTGDGGTYGQLPGGALEDDGKFRVCNLHPGQYQLQVQTPDRGIDGPLFYAALPLIITDQDVDRISLAPAPRVPMTVEVVWDGTPPQTPPANGLQVALQSLTRTDQIGGQISIPGKVSLKELAIDDHVVRVLGALPQGAYIKDITYGAESVLYRPVRPGTASGDSTLKVVLAANGGRVRASIADKDGNPIPDAAVVAFPESAHVEQTLADTMINGRADQNGSWTSIPLAPGKYEVLALDLPAGVNLDRSPESLMKLLRARGKAQEIEVGAGASAQVTLAVLPLD